MLIKNSLQLFQKSSFFLSFFVTSLFCEIPYSISYQGLIINQDREPYNGPVDIRASILDKNNIEIWIGDKADIHVKDGILSIVIDETWGTGFSEIPWDEPYKLRIENPLENKLIGEISFTSVPQALSVPLLSFDIANNYVGIGISNPLEKLDVAGTIRADDFIKSDGTPLDGSKWDNSGNDIFYNAGNVGIGTGFPNEKLTVDGSLSLININQPLPTSGYGKLYISSSDKKLYFLDEYGIEYNLITEGIDEGDSGIEVVDEGTNGSLIFTTDNTPAMIIESSGNVGIGTSEPGAALEVAGDIIVDNIHLATSGIDSPDNIIVAIDSKQGEAASIIERDLGKLIEKTARKK